MLRRLVFLTLSLSGMALAVPVTVVPDPLGPVPDGAPFNPALSGNTTSVLQQVTLSSAFGSLGPAFLTGLDFRYANGNNAPFVMTGATISASVTPVTPAGLSLTQAANLGPGGLSLVASNYTLQAAAGLFNLHVQLDTPFFYNPASGNLLLQFDTPGNSGPSVAANSASPVAGSVWVVSPLSLGNTGVYPTFADTIQYQFDTLDTPELDPRTASGCALFAAVALLLLKERRKVA